MKDGFIFSSICYCCRKKRGYKSHKRLLLAVSGKKIMVKFKEEKPGKISTDILKQLINKKFRT